MKLLLESQYFPSVAYFSLLYYADEVYLDVHEHFVKQTYRNRFQIPGSNRVLNLSVPVHHAGRKIPIRELRIDYQQKWVNNHWRAIRSAYGKAPFFDFYADFFHDEIHGNHTHLFNLNQSLLTICLKLLKLDVIFRDTPEYWKTAPEGVIDFRSVIHPKKPIDNLTWFQPQRYHQIFGKDFVPNMSILDLLFCTGPDAIDVLRVSGVLLKNN